MEKLLIINGVPFQEDMDGGYDITYTDKTNVYESESGEKTVEVIRRNICRLSVKYNGLLENKVRKLCAAIRPVNEVTYYNPTESKTEKKIMKADENRISVSKQYYKETISAWSLSFSLEEM